MKQLILGLLLCLGISAYAASPVFNDFNANQFSTTGNKVAVKSGALLTNGVFTGRTKANDIISIQDSGTNRNGTIRTDGEDEVFTGMVSDGTEDAEAIRFYRANVLQGTITENGFEGNGFDMTLLGDTRIGTGAIGTNTMLFSPTFIGPYTSTGNALFSVRTAQSGFDGYWTNSIYIERWETNTATSRPWTLVLMNRGEVAGGSDYQNEVTLNYVAGAPFTGNPHRRYDSYWIPDASSPIGYVRDWERGVNASSTVQYSESINGLHRMYWYYSSRFQGPATDGVTMINSGTNGAVKINAQLDGNAWLGTGGLEVHSGGNPSTKVGGITGAGEGHFAGTIYQSNLTASRVLVSDSNKGHASSATTGPILGTGAAAAGTDIVGAFTGTPDGSKFLADDGTLKTPAGSGDTFWETNTAAASSTLSTNNVTVGGALHFQSDGVNGWHIVTNITDLVLSNTVNGAAFVFGSNGVFTANSVVLDELNATSFNTDTLVVTNGIYTGITNAAVLATDEDGMIIEGSASGGTYTYTLWVGTPITGSISTGGQTNFFGMNANDGLTTTYANVSGIIPVTGVITNVSIRYKCVAGTSENIDVRLKQNASTESAIGVLVMDTARAVSNYPNLNISVTAGDTFAVMLANADMTTEPTGTSFGGYITIRVP